MPAPALRHSRSWMFDGSSAVPVLAPKYSRQFEHPRQHYLDGRLLHSRSTLAPNRSMRLASRGANGVLRRATSPAIPRVPTGPSLDIASS